MLQLPPEELTRLLFNLSHEELLVWFGDVSWREDALHEGRREKVENFLCARFGSVDEELSGAIAKREERSADRINVAVTNTGVDSPAALLFPRGIVGTVWRLTSSPA